MLSAFKSSRKMRKTDCALGIAVSRDFESPPKCSLEDNAYLYQKVETPNQLRKIEKSNKRRSSRTCNLGLEQDATDNVSFKATTNSPTSALHRARFDFQQGSTGNYSVENSTILHLQHVNIKERSRSHSVNDAFSHLRALIPTDPPDRKLSKIETLRLATSYISHLSSLIKYFDHQELNPGYNNDLGYVSCSSGSNKICTFCVSFLRSLSQH